MDVEAEQGDDVLLALDEALQRLCAEAALGISLRTANRHWAYAKAWLYRHMRGRDATDA